MRRRGEEIPLCVNSHVPVRVLLGFIRGDSPHNYGQLLNWKSGGGGDPQLGIKDDRRLVPLPVLIRQGCGHIHG